MTSAIPWMNSGGDLRQQLNMVINDGSTVAWYQPGVGVTGTLNASAWANQLGAAGSLAQATGANQPIVLPYAGAKYAWLPAVANNYPSTPDSVPASIVGDIDVRAQLAPNAWTGTGQAVLAKDTTGAGARSYALLIGVIASGKLDFAYSNDGTSIVGRVATSSVETGFAAGSLHWIRATYAAATGKVNFYTSDDGAAWTILGTEQTITSGAIADTAAIVSVGIFGNGTTSPLLGKIYRAQIYDGINGTLAVDYNAADWSETATNGATQASSTTGEVWTLNNIGALKAQIVGSPSLLFDGTADYMQAAFTLNQPNTIYTVVKQVTWTILDTIFDGDEAGISITAQVAQSTATPKITMFAGSIIGDNANLAVNAYGVLTAVFNGASSSLQIDSTAAVTGDAGAGNAGGMTLGANGLTITAQFGNIQAKEVIIRNVADSAATKARIQALLKAIHGTP